MASSTLQITELDFDRIKTNLKNFLKSQSQFQDYDFEGASLNILLDILAYNTHYNAYYLNMVANESFLDSAITRDAVVSHAKSLGYTPYSVKASKAKINLIMIPNTYIGDEYVLPRGFEFRTSRLENRSYTFVVMEDFKITKVGGSFLIENLELYEGQLTTLSFAYDSVNNPKAVFTLPDTNIDTSTLKVSVRESISNTDINVYQLASDLSTVKSDSLAYYLQETRNFQYQIYFGNDILGKKLKNGNIVIVEYLATSGSVANKCSEFVLSTDAQGFSSIAIETLESSRGGIDRENIDSIKLLSSHQYTSQNRLVTVKDYESYLIGKIPSIQSLSVWGGEDEIPPVYGKIYLSLNMMDGYYISDDEKDRIINEIIKPKSMLSVQIEIKDPDYVYLELRNKIRYDKKKTVLTEGEIDSLISTTVNDYTLTNLNRFGATFVLSKLQEAIDNINTNYIIGCESTLWLQKRFRPTLNATSTYNLSFNATLKQGSSIRKLYTSEFVTLDSFGVARTAQIEEIPDSYTGVVSINIDNPGYNYKKNPIVQITGDGKYATATANIINGQISSIDIVERGINYNKAIVTITNAQGDTSGYGAIATAILNSNFGVLRMFYYDEKGQKVIIRDKIGTVDYNTGEVLITDIFITEVLENDGYFRISTRSEDTVLVPKRNTIFTIDSNDKNSVVNEFISV